MSKLILPEELMRMISVVGLGLAANMFECIAVSSVIYLSSIYI